MRAADHLGLAWQMCKWARRTFGGETREYLATCWMALERACAGYEVGRGNSFAAYACSAMRRAVKRQVSFDRGTRRTNINDETVVVRGSMSWAAAEPNRDESGIVLHERWWFYRLSRQERTVVSMILRGWSQAHIATDLGVTRQRANQIVKAVRARLVEEGVVHDSSAGTSRDEHAREAAERDGAVPVRGTGRTARAHPGREGAAQGVLADDHTVRLGRVGVRVRVRDSGGGWSGHSAYIERVRNRHAHAVS